MPPIRIGIFFSGVGRNLASSAYNNRVDECKASAFALAAYAGLYPGRKLADMYLRDIPPEVFDAYKDRLPAPWRKRCAHFYSESRRVAQGIEAWKRGDVVAFGRLITESGRSSIENYECGSPELIRLYEILSGLDGVYGARFSGAGFKGCCMALIDPTKSDQIKRTVEREYLATFPAMKETYKAYMCATADGVGKRE